MDIFPSKEVKKRRWWGYWMENKLFPGDFVKQEGEYVCFKDKAGMLRRWHKSNVDVLQLEND